jgi:hypothetical protein
MSYQTIIIIYTLYIPNYCFNDIVKLSKLKIIKKFNKKIEYSILLMIDFIRYLELKWKKRDRKFSILHN